MAPGVVNLLGCVSCLIQEVDGGFIWINRVDTHTHTYIYILYIYTIYIYYIYIHVYILVYIIEFMDSMNQMVQMKVMKGQTGWGPIYWLTGLLRFRLVQEWRTAIYELANESRGGGRGSEGPCHSHGHGCRHRVICCAKNLSTLSQL